MRVSATRICRRANAPRERVCRALLTVAALALCSLGGVCGRTRDRPAVSTRHAATPPAARDTGPWVRLAGSHLREELDTTTIVRGDSNVYAGWVRRPVDMEQAAGESYHARYEVDCVAWLVRTTDAAVYGDTGQLERTISRAEIMRSGEDRWWVARSRSLEVVARTICDRVRDAHLPIARGQRH